MLHNKVAALAEVSSPGLALLPQTTAIVGAAPIYRRSFRPLSNPFARR
jgi:hypothetical protein